MTLDEAIAHCLEVAEQNETSAITYKNCKEIKANMYEKLTAEKAENDCRECAADHRQLAEWLTELKELRDENKVLMHECDRLIKEKGKLLKKSEQIAEYKRLLKSATNVLKMFIPCDEDYNCNECIKQRQNCDYDDSFKWRYADEALALIGEDTNAPATEDDTNVGHKSGDWISCKDRLPSENTLVLCYARSTTGEGNDYFLGALAHGEFWFLKVNDIGHVSYPVLHWKVTHWQPLPESPKE